MTETLQDAAPGASGAADSSRVAENGARRRIPGALLAAACVAAVALLHFRPWQGGLVEEWGLLQAWQQQGFSAYTNPWSMEMTLGRPLHLFWAYFAFTVSGGSFVGLSGLMAAVAVAQLLFAAWGLGALTRSVWLRWTLALLVATHPWWSAGATLRYLPAQIAVLGVVVWAALAAHYLRSGRTWMLAVGCAALLVGLLTYPAPAVAVGLGALAFATALAPTLRRALTVVLVTGGTVALDAAWSLLVAPRLGDTYESQLATVVADKSIKNALRGIATAMLDVPAVVLLLGGVALVVIALGLAQAIPQWRAWALLGLVLSTPLAGFAYFPSAFHLHSPEHVPQVVGLALWLVLAAVAGEIGSQRVLRGLVGAGCVLLAAVTSFAAYDRWTDAAVAQQGLLDLAVDHRAQIPPGEILVIEDRTGQYGSLYLLVPPTLDTAVHVEAGDGPAAVLCTPADVARAPGVGTPDCAAYLASGEATDLGDGMTPLGSVTFYSAVPVP